MFSFSRREFLSRLGLAAAVTGVVAGLPATASAAPMVKCPFCSFDNEDGALFCEQCGSDLPADPPKPGPPGRD